ncbi:MAG: hypothetical protein Q8P15_00695 [Nanoarchaeota archaeon]|nr:hypothetical protein [Nanoarchaeota archaeon]
MDFYLQGKKRRKDIYDFFIKCDKDWTLGDFMQEINLSPKSIFHLEGDYIHLKEKIPSKELRNNSIFKHDAYAFFTLHSTLYRGIKILQIRDRGIGAQALGQILNPIFRKKTKLSN